MPLSGNEADPDMRDRSSCRRGRTDRWPAIVREHSAAQEIPGYVQCKWLLADFSDNVAAEFQNHLAKGEGDLLRLSREMLIHSRILTSSTARPMKQESVGTREGVLASWDSHRGVDGGQRDRAPAPYASAAEEGDSLPTYGGAPSSQR